MATRVRIPLGTPFPLPPSPAPGPPRPRGGASGRRTGGRRAGGRRAARAIGAALLGWAVWAPAPAGERPPCTAQGLPPVRVEVLARGLRRPVALAVRPGEPGRLYVAEQAGRVRVLERAGARWRLLPEPYLDLGDRVVAGGEKGLLGLAFHPRRPELYLSYTQQRGKGLYSRLVRLPLAGAERPDPEREELLLEVAQPFPNHNGGQVAFGPDGFLYLGLGDGGWANDPLNHGQNPGTLLGALLRLDVDRRAGGRPYAIPPDNPLVGRPGARPEVYAYGFRNPWRFSFDRATGELWLADVGQDAREEIDRVRPGRNYGWRIMEGDRCTPGVAARCDRRGLEPPVHAYGHEEGRAVIGGYVYRGRALPGLRGAYLFADYVSRRLWALRRRGGRAVVCRLAALPDAPSSFGEDAAGELYLLGHRRGWLLGLVPGRAPGSPASPGGRAPGGAPAVGASKLGSDAPRAGPP
ncbi:MAG: glucose dehydrogenase [Gammaproteobacteria bacterium]|nr:MAG: glucose dehydrogenase [Gammaproteobacteria bacterium]